MIKKINIIFIIVLLHSFYSNLLANSFNNTAINQSSTPNCSPLNLPFKEDFKQFSTTKNCWKMIDNNANGKATLNKWRYFNNEVILQNITKKNEDDWLITPLLLSTGKYVQLEFWIRSDIWRIQ